MVQSAPIHKSVDSKERYGEQRCDTKLKQAEGPSPVEDDTQLNPLLLCLNIYYPMVYLVICMEGEK